MNKQHRELAERANHYFGFNLGTRNRGRNYVNARRMFAAVMRDYYEATYKEIGRALGNMDHSTSIHHYQRHHALISLKEIRGYQSYYHGYLDFVKHMTLEVDDYMAMSDLKAWSFQLIDALSGGNVDDVVDEIVRKAQELREGTANK